MKKILGIIVLGLLLSTSANAVVLSWQCSGGDNFKYMNWQLDLDKKELNSQYVEKNNNLTLQNYNRTYVKNWLKYFIFELQLILFPLFRRDKASVVALEDTYNMPLFLREMSQNNDKLFPVYLSIQQNRGR